MSRCQINYWPVARKFYRLVCHAPTIGANRFIPAARCFSVNQCREETVPTRERRFQSMTS